MMETSAMGRKKVVNRTGRGHGRIIATFAAVCMGLTGCSHPALNETPYTPPMADQASASITGYMLDTGTLHTDWYWLVSKIDGKQVDLSSCKTWWSINACSANNTLITPGEHKLVILAYTAGGLSASATTVSFSAKSGHHYIVKGELPGNGTLTWVEEKETGIAMTGKTLPDAVRQYRPAHYIFIRAR